MVPMSTGLGTCLRVDERRLWQRLPLAIPIFVRGADRHGNEFVELTTATDISAGGALVAIHHEVKPGSRLKLEIPCVPVLDRRRKSPRTQVFTAKVLRTASSQDLRLFALKFSKALIDSPEVPKRAVAAAARTAPRKNLQNKNAEVLSS
jgi:hypothetical protein